MSQSMKKISYRKNPTSVKCESKSALNNSSLSSSVNDLRNRKSMDSTTALEAEYIKSLQQQIYLLELENNHLRQQTLKATEIQPIMTAEAEKMLDNLKMLQKKVNSLELELFRKEGHVDILNSKISQLTKKLENQSDKHLRERNVMMGESMSTRKDADQLERELSRKTIVVNELKDDLQRNSSNLQAAENKVELLRAQLQEEMQKTREAEIQLSEKKEEMLKVDSKLRELENRYIANNNNFQEGLKKELRDEVAYLKQKLKDASEIVEREQMLRTKLSEDASKLIKENAVLNRQIVDLQGAVENERSTREKFDNRRSQDKVELDRLQEHEKELEFQLRKLQHELDTEKARTSRLMEEMAKQDKVYSSRALDDSLSRKKVGEIEHRNVSLSHENDKLRQDKENLIEHIDNLQDEIKQKDKQLTENQKILIEMETRVSQLENLKSLDDMVQFKRWGELEQTIDSLKSQAHLMANMSRPQSNSPIKKQLSWENV